MRVFWHNSSIDANWPKHPASSLDPKAPGPPLPKPTMPSRLSLGNPPHTSYRPKHSASCATLPQLSDCLTPRYRHQQQDCSLRWGAQRRWWRGRSWNWRWIGCRGPGGEGGTKWRGTSWLERALFVGELLRMERDEGRGQGCIPEGSWCWAPLMHYANLFTPHTNNKENDTTHYW